MLLVAHLSFSHAKQLLMKLLFESLQTYANPLLELMPANYIATRCVNPCPLVFIRVGISIQKRLDLHLDKTRPAALKTWSCPISNEQGQNVKLKASLQQADRRKSTALVFCSHCNTVFQAMACFYHLCRCQELHPSLTEKDIQRGSKKRELDALKRHFIQEKGFKVIEMWECEWSRLYKTTNSVKQHIGEHFPYRRSLAAEQLLEEKKRGKFFGYMQCDIDVPENLRANVASFPPIFKNTSVGKSDIGDWKKNYAREERLLSQPRKMLISSFTLQNGTLTTPLLVFYLQLGLVCTKIHRFVEYTPKKCFNSFVQSVVNSRRQGDEIPSPIQIRTTPYLNTLSRTIPYLNTLNRTIPYLNTLNRTLPYLSTLTRTIPYLNTLNRTLPYLKTLPNHTLS